MNALEKFVFNNKKSVVVSNVLSITKEEINVGPKMYEYSIKILYVSGKDESVYYFENLSERDNDFDRFSNLKEN